MALALIVLVILIAALRYGADTRDGRDWSGPSPSGHPLPSAGHLGARPTVRRDVVRLVRVARTALHRRPSQPTVADTAAFGDAALCRC